MNPRDRRIRQLEVRARELKQEDLEREFQGRSEEELMFFSVHGYWPEAADVSERTESSFVVRGLKTTVILEGER